MKKIIKNLGIFLLTGFVFCASEKMAIADPPPNPDGVQRGGDPFLRWEPSLLNQTQPKKYAPIDLLAQELNPVIESEEAQRSEMSQSRQQKLISFLYRNPEIIYIVLTAIVMLMGLGIVGIWLVLFKVRKLKEPQTIQLDAVTLATLTELRNVFLETQNSLFWLQDYLENATTNQSQSRPTSDWSSFSPSIRDSQVFEPDTSHRLTNQTEDSPMNNGESESISNSMQANEFLEQGNALLVQGRYEAAIAAYEQSLKLEPTRGQAWLNRGCALFYLKEYEEAIASYDQALHRSGDLPDAWYNRAGALAKLHQYDQAIACYERATQLKPDYLAAWHDRGLTLVSLQRYSEALICFKQTIQLKPNAPEFRLDLGRTLTHLHQYQEAIAAYEEAIELQANNAVAWSQKGWVLAAMQRYEEAIASYDQALKLNPNEAMVWNYLALALAELQQEHEALAAYDQALKLKPNWPTVQNNRAAVLMKLQRYPEAIAACNQAIAIQPDEPAIWYNKACCYGIQGDVDGAIENLQQAMQRNPQTYQQLATTDADFDPIRQNPRFQQIIQQPLERSV
jgi:tetratricopeptide (TPR) repeat protein